MFCHAREFLRRTSAVSRHAHGVSSSLFDASLFHAREYHNTSQAVRQTSNARGLRVRHHSRASHFGGTATRSLYRARRYSGARLPPKRLGRSASARSSALSRRQSVLRICLGDERPPVRALRATRPVSTVRCKAKDGWRTKGQIGRQAPRKIRGPPEGGPLIGHCQALG